MANDTATYYVIQIKSTRAKQTWDLADHDLIEAKTAATRRCEHYKSECYDVRVIAVQVPHK